MDKIFEKVLPGKTGFAVEVKKGQVLRVIDLEGKQVCDMALFNLDNLREKLSTSHSRTRYVPKTVGDYVPRDKLMEGDTLSSITIPGHFGLTLIRNVQKKRGYF